MRTSGTIGHVIVSGYEGHEDVIACLAVQSTENGLEVAVNWLKSMGMNVDSNFKIEVKEFEKELKERVKANPIAPDFSGLEFTKTQGNYLVELSMDSLGKFLFRFVLIKNQPPNSSKSH